MQQHAMALGYFFLAAFCVFTSLHSFVELRLLLLLAALLAIVTGLAYVAGPLAARIRAMQVWLMKVIRLAQQPPARPSTTPDETRA